MKLAQLLEDAGKYAEYKADSELLTENPEISGVSDFTEDIAEGFIFVCVKGGRFDGHSAAEDMLKKGAAAVVCERDLGLPKQIIVENSRYFYGYLVAAMHGHPEKKLTLIGVTGTNGKTTMTTLIRDILARDGRKVGLIGTTGVFSGTEPIERDESTPTTPKVGELYSIFEKMCADGCTAAVMEVTSFALHQNRIGPAFFDYAVFTNLTQDHLDYHGDMENYYLAKRLLFDRCGYAVVNTDDEYGKRLFSEISCDKCSYGLHPDADVNARDIVAKGDKIHFILSDFGTEYPISLGMMGRFNAANTAAAVKVALKMGVSADIIEKSLEESKGVRGRCEIIPTGRDFMLICDYAHSPDALENVLPALKEQITGRLICLFGCGGDRDRTKRPKMGAAAEKYADYLIVTSDNPRNEDPDAIIDDIFTGLTGTKPCDRITDRREAIFHAVKIAEKGDLVLLAGKGHEDYQILAGGKHIHFDEREIAAEALEQLT